MEGGLQITIIALIMLVWVFLFVYAFVIFQIHFTDFTIICKIKFPYCFTGMPFILFLSYLIDLEFLFHDKCNQPLLGYWSELKLTYNATHADCIFPSLPCTIICNGKNREDKRIRR